jgi:hypothetical protein
VKKENPALQYDEYKTSQFNLANNLKYIHKTSYILRKYKEILKRKATIWEYENEYRLQFHYSVCTYRKEIDMWFFHFHHEIIREVYLGIKCKAELKSKILSLLAAQEYRHVKVYQASKSAGYQIKYIRIK